jgi:hypothetical protein
MAKKVRELAKNDNSKEEKSETAAMRKREVEPKKKGKK